MNGRFATGSMPFWAVLPFCILIAASCAPARTEKSKPDIEPPLAIEPAPAVEPPPVPEEPSEPERVMDAFDGTASWYGNEFHGQETASGDVYDQNGLTAAHPDWPFGTRVKVTNPDNGREVTVRINDRGPFVGGRDIDLSRAAARQLGINGEGTTRVRLEVLEWGEE